MQGWKTSGLVLLMALAMASLLFVHRLDTGGDNLDYLYSVGSIQRGQWAELLAWPRPPGYPLYLASVLWVAGEKVGAGPFQVTPFSVNLVKMLNALQFVLTAVVVYAWARRIAKGRRLAFYVALLFAANQTLAALSSVIGAEPFLALVTFAALLVWETVRQDDPQSMPVLMGFACLVSLALYVKTQALPLAAAFLLWVVLFRRWRKPYLVAAGIVTVFTAGAVALVLLGGRYHMDRIVASDPYGLGQPVSAVGRLLNAIITYSSGWADLLMPKVLGDRGVLELAGVAWLSWPFVALVVSLMIVGFVRTLRREFLPSHLYLLGYGGMLLVWPDQLSRYLLPIAPLGLWMLLEGVEAVALGVSRVLHRDENWPAGALASVVVVALAWSLGVNLFAGVKNARHIWALRHLPPWAPERYVMSREDDFADYITAGQWLGVNAPSNVVIFCRKALFIELTAGRRCEYYSAFATPEDLWQRIRTGAESQPVFILKDNFSTETTYGKVRELKLTPALKEHADQVEVLHRTDGGSEILRVIPLS